MARYIPEGQKWQAGSLLLPLERGEELREMVNLPALDDFDGVIPSGS